MPESPLRVVVLVSGSGTNLQALLDAAADPAYGAAIVAVGADRDGIEGLARAERAGIPTFVHRVKDFDTRADWDAALTDAVAAHRARPGRLGGLHEAGRADVPGGVRRALRQHPPGAVAVVPGHARARATRWRTA